MPSDSGVVFRWLGVGDNPNDDQLRNFPPPDSGTVDSLSMPPPSTRSQTAAIRASSSTCSLPVTFSAQTTAAPPTGGSFPITSPSSAVVAVPPSLPIIEMVDVPDRNLAISVAVLNQSYPSPATYDDIDPKNRDKYTLQWFGRAPWFDRQVLEAGLQFILPYADEGRYLPADIHVDALSTFSWRHHFSIHDSDLRINYGRTPVGVRREFVKAAHGGIYRLLTTELLSSTLGMDLFVSRTRGEVPYISRLAAIPEERLESWREQVMVAQEALCFTKPQLCVEFRYIRKDSRYWTDYVRGERRARTKTGLAIPYQCTTHHLMTDEGRRAAFPRVTSGWDLIEVPRGCHAELPPVFSYKGSVLRDRYSGWWVVAYTELIAKTAAFVLFDTYDSLRLWSLSKRCIAFCRQLDLVPVLGNAENAREFMDLLNLIEETDFASYPEEQRNRVR